MTGPKSASVNVLTNIMSVQVVETYHQRANNIENSNTNQYKHKLCNGIYVKQKPIKETKPRKRLILRPEETFAHFRQRVKNK